MNKKAEDIIYISTYRSSIGNILLAEKNKQLVGLWLENQKYYLAGFDCAEKIEKDSEILIKTKQWLDRYFNKENPNINELDLNPYGSEFQASVWNILKKIPYGQTITYKEIAAEIAKEKGVKSMSAQAVGNAVGHNPISIIIPCHRVVGTNGSLTGYAGGLDKKIWLLKHENVNTEQFFAPSKGTAL